MVEKVVTVDMEAEAGEAAAVEAMVDEVAAEVQATVVEVCTSLVFLDFFFFFFSRLVTRICG